MIRTYVLPQDALKLSSSERKYRRSKLPNYVGLHEILLEEKQNVLDLGKINGTIRYRHSL